MKRNLLILLTAFALFLSSCEKDDEVLITKIEVKNVKIVPAYYSVDISWKVSSDATISEVFVQYATDASFSKYKEVKMTSEGSNQYQISISGLTDNTLYYIRCKAQNKINSHIDYSNNFTTKKKTTPTVDKVTAKASYTSITCTANISDDGGQQITARGICYATTSMPTTANPSIACGSGGGSYTCTIPNLTPETTYYIRAYAIYNGQTTYGSQNAYTTLPYTTPTVTTASSATTITNTSAAISNNKVTDDGGLTVTSRGVCYSTSPTPTTANSTITSGSGTGSFTCNLTGLTRDSKYYVRAYATNSKGTSYGKEINFTTLGKTSTITYKASAKLDEVTGYSSGLHTDAFDFPIYSHTFSSGTGTIIFDGVITKVGDRAFSNCNNMTSISIPSSVTSIGSLAFYSCKNITSITIPSSVTSIGIFAFYYCSGLTSITIPSNVTSIKSSAFQNCSSLTSITVNSSNTKYSSSSGVLFNKNQTTLIIYPCGKQGSYTIPSTVSSIDSDAFDYCTGLTSITIPSSVTSIGSSAFYCCSNLTSITVNSSNTKYSSSSGVLFNKDQTTLILYPPGKTGASYTIPSGVTSIESFAFYSCKNITSITIPSSVTKIDNYIFGSNNKLESITCKATTPPTLSSYTFDDVEKSIPVKVPSASVSKYKAAEGWKEFTNIQSY